MLCYSIDQRIAVRKVAVECRHPDFCAGGDCPESDIDTLLTEEFLGSIDDLLTICSGICSHWKVSFLMDQAIVMPIQAGNQCEKKPYSRRNRP